MLNYNQYKEELIIKNNLEELLSDKIEASKYKKYKIQAYSFTD